MEANPGFELSLGVMASWYFLPASMVLRSSWKLSLVVSTLVILMGSGLLMVMSMVLLLASLPSSQSSVRGVSWTISGMLMRAVMVMDAL